MTHLQKLKVPLIKNAFLDEKNTRRLLADFILGEEKLSMGEQCFAFERAFAMKQGRKEAILFNSGGSANLAMIQALKNMGKLKDSDKVGFSALTWATNIMPIIQMGLNPIPIDVDRDALNVMSYNIKERLEKTNLDAIFLTNVIGFAGDLCNIKKLCEERDILLIEDNCESLGTELPGGKAGNFSLASSFSFYVAHHMSTIEGGMVCTDDEELAEMLKIVRANGWDRNLKPHQQKKWRNHHGINSEFHSKYAFYDLGFNLRPTEITGVLGLSQLKLLDKSIEIREKNFLRAEEHILENNDLIPVKRGHIKKVSSFVIPVICKTPELQNKYVEKFLNTGIEIRPMIAGNMQRQPFHKKYASEMFDLPNTDFLHDNSFYCGNCPDYTEEEIQIILNCLKKIE